ncbi:MAG: molybdate ABC transporter substrate-binding protein [Candidatus Scalindua sp. AMX11]|nr:MAG: molybdate ABC transporter substrate-binding protein [Candidatus Scalindua sp.]NOG83177.1 molybdate ABC transporter substrate-binding protein [Planctomycetota bacterium]RZV77544.1 MAG: molybdate ABC transporter substrate-binding protein [Candidatus Scalindua sp. SCAELEC01]TDE64576.1 MAG: molybdate ABC transporter substrate-binding protein [Candidatus Scalindua sp. AMX11]GJQ58607.1 MAG: molybdate-binding periplasmic protein ModA [Candidatus Scalindua sp.]
MKKPLSVFTLVVSIVLIFGVGRVVADEIQVAVASNFTTVIQDMAKRFTERTGHKVTLIFGSTGKHYAQIINGAPFDAFFAADVRRPELLAKEGVALSGSRFTYAVGKVVLWSPRMAYVDSAGKILEQREFRYLAIANPKLAPYGRAAQEILEAKKIWVDLQRSIVRGENIGQTFQFVKSGNAELGFVAYSQIKRPGNPIEGSFWEIPQSLYTPIEQQAVLLKENNIARSFLAFVKSEESRNLIREYGYSVR